MKLIIEVEDLDAAELASLAEATRHNSMMHRALLEWTVPMPGDDWGSSRIHRRRISAVEVPAIPEEFSLDTPAHPGESLASRRQAIELLTDFGLNRHSIALVLKRAYLHTEASFSYGKDARPGNAVYDRETGMYTIRTAALPIREWIREQSLWGRKAAPRRQARASPVPPRASPRTWPPGCPAACPRTSWPTRPC
jgi:hypothetical protein